MPRTIAKVGESFSLTLFLEQDKKIFKNKKANTLEDKRNRKITIQRNLSSLKTLTDKIQALEFFSKDLALEHSGYRRFELFFLTCCLVYDSKYHYEIDETSAQGGSGLRFNEKYGRERLSFTTNACHSSIIAGLRRCEQIKWEKDRVESPRREPLKTKDWDAKFLRPLHLFLSVNSTIELPRHINDVDRQIEGKNGLSIKQMETSSRMPLRAIKIINRTALDKNYTPDKALVDFKKEMKKLYKFLNVYVDKKYSGPAKSLKLKILGMQEKGFKKVARIIGEKYFGSHLLLELSKPVQKTLLRTVPFNDL